MNKATQRYKAYKARKRQGKVKTKTRMVFNDVKVTAATKATLMPDKNEKAKMVFNSVDITDETKVNLVPGETGRSDFSRAR